MDTKNIQAKQITNAVHAKLQANKEHKGKKSGQVKLSPSKSRILNMSYPVLIEHYALIQYKKSSLSANQRRWVENRVKYLLDKSTISQAEIDLSLQFIGNLVKSPPSGK